MKVDKAIEYLESIGYSVSGYGNSYVSGATERYEKGVRFIEIRKITDLLKSLATRCQDYDALLDELKSNLSKWGTPVLSSVVDNIERLEEKYIWKKHD